jgi:hypothetical protein
MPGRALSGSIENQKCKMDGREGRRLAFVVSPPIAQPPRRRRPVYGTLDGGQQAEGGNGGVDVLPGGETDCYQQGCQFFCGELRGDRQWGRGDGGSSGGAVGLNGQYKRVYRDLSNDAAF